MFCEDYPRWNIRSAMADALRQLGLHEKAKHIHENYDNKEIFDDYLSIIIKSEDKLLHNEMLERTFISCVCG